MSAEDKAKVEELLRAFDPNSYDLKLNYIDARGVQHKFQAGKAIGLSQLQQSQTVAPGAAIPSPVPAATMRAGSNATINMFKQAATHIPLFANQPDLQQKSQQLNQILQKYSVGQ